MSTDIPDIDRAIRKVPATRQQDTAYEEIKRRVITMAYRPGTYINEAGICKDLSMGRTPVHMALERLAIEGMIEIIPRKCIIVTPISIDEIRSLVETRLLTEPKAARLAAERASDPEIRRLEKIAKLARTIKPKNTEALMELDRDFHSTIADATRNRVLAQILKGLHERSLRHWFISLSSDQRDRKVADEHDGVVKAISARDPDMAELMMREHIESLSTVTMQYRQSIQ